MRTDLIYDAFLSNVESDYINAQNSLNIVVGRITYVNPKTMKMHVDVPVLGNNSRIRNIDINMPVSLVGGGVRFMPVPNVTYAVLQQGLKGWVHIGYYLEGIDNATLFKDAREVTEHKPFQYLEPGEVEISSISNGRLYLSKLGNVLIEDGYGNYLLLNGLSSLLDVFVSTGKFEFSGVRVRGGDILRNSKEDPKEEEYLAKSDDPKELKEFTVFVGTTVDSNTGLDPEITNPDTGVNMYPTVGVLSLSTEVTDVKGDQEKIQDKLLQFLLRMASGIGLAITEQGELLIYDYATSNFISFVTGKLDNNPNTSFRMKIQNCDIQVTSQETITIKNANYTFFIDKENILKISNQKSFIHITKENELKVANDKGSVTIASDGTITIKGGQDKVTITLSSSGLQIEAQGTVQIQAQSAIQLQSSAGVNIMGSPVNINGALTVS